MRYADGRFVVKGVRISDVAYYQIPSQKSQIARRQARTLIRKSILQLELS
jgi:hypothetical protein